MNKIRVKSKAMRDTTQMKVVKIIAFIVFVIYSVSLLFPFAWMILNMFKSNQEFFADVWALPSSWSMGWTNLETALTKTMMGSTIFEMTLRSLWLSLAGTILSLLSASSIAYVVAKYKFFGRNFLYLLAIMVMVVPTIGSTSATYKLIGDLNLFDNPIALLLLYSGGFGFQFLLLYGAYKSISWSYAEAAFIDGANDFSVYFRIMIPMVFPSMLPLGILNFIGFWNDYFTPYLYLKNKPTLAVGLQAFVNQMEYDANWPALFALMLFSMIPIIILFLVFQKKIMANVTTGGLKG
ncbi:MAG: carbohydrate ABC transporter permease [Bacilli bacterium]|nr:carbohydrate ABC transporter permease [Bacilli bacterium]